MFRRRSGKAQRNSATWDTPVPSVADPETENGTVTVAPAPGQVTVTAGAAAAAAMVTVRSGVVAVSEPLAAMTAKEHVAACVGVPDSFPPLDRLSPAASVPLARLNVGAGYPVAASV